MNTGLFYLQALKIDSCASVEKKSTEICGIYEYFIITKKAWKMHWNLSLLPLNNYLYFVWLKLKGGPFKSFLSIERKNKR